MSSSTQPIRLNCKHVNWAICILCLATMAWLSKRTIKRNAISTSIPRGNITRAHWKWLRWRHSCKARPIARRTIIWKRQSLPIWIFASECEHPRSHRLKHWFLFHFLHWFLSAGFRSSQRERRFWVLSAFERPNCSTKPPNNWFAWPASIRICHQPFCSSRPLTHSSWLNRRSIENMPSTLCSLVIGTQSVANASMLFAATNRRTKCSRIANGVWPKTTSNTRLASKQSHWRNWTKLAVRWHIYCVRQVCRVQRNRVLSSGSTLQRRKPIWSKRATPIYCWTSHCRKLLGNQFECLLPRRHQLPHRIGFRPPTSILM